MKGFIMKEGNHETQAGPDELQRGATGHCDEPGSEAREKIHNNFIFDHFYFRNFKKNRFFNFFF